MTNKHPSISTKSYTGSQTGRRTTSVRSPSPAPSENEEANASFITQQAPVILNSNEPENPPHAEEQANATSYPAQKVLPVQSNKAPLESFPEALQRRWNLTCQELDEVSQQASDSFLNPDQLQWIRKRYAYLQEHEQALRHDISRYIPDPHLKAYQDALATFGEAA
ncbi:hypothetical protein BG015_006932, partial [Linnemannia schmuckeri]